MSAITWLKKPFPEPQTGTASWRLNLTISFSVTLILLIFQPFGLYALPQPEKFIFIAGYGLVTMVIISIFMILIPMLFPSSFKSENWKVWKHIIFLMSILMSIGFGNLIYTMYFIANFTLSLQDLLIFEGLTLLIGIFPVAGSIAYSYIKHLKRNLNAAEAISKDINTTNEQKTEESITIEGQNKKEKLTIKIDSLLFIKADGNYLHIYFKEKNTTGHTLIRNTLHNIEQKLEPYQTIIRCHRAYLINSNAIKNVTGNAQGLKLTLNQCNIAVPVSRKYVTPVRKLLETGSLKGL